MSQRSFFLTALLVVLLFFICATFAQQTATNSSNPIEIEDVDSGELIYNRTETPDGWVLSDRAAGDVIVNLTINLHPRNLDVATELLRNISDPSHPQYGHHLSAEELTDLVAPNATVIENLRHWFSQHSMNFSDMAVYHTFVRFTANVSTVEQLFNTTMYWYVHGESGQRVVVQQGNSHVPGAVHSFVSSVVGLNDFPIVRQHYSVRHIQILPTPPDESDNTNNNHLKDDSFTTNLEHTWKLTNTFNHQYYVPTNVPQTLTNIYGIPDNRAFVPPTNYNASTSHCVAQFSTILGDQSFSPSDLQTYSTALGHSSTLSVPSDRIVGTNIPSTPGIEGTLDIQTTLGLNPQAAGWFYIMPVDGWILEFTNDFLASTDALPQVVSISYGGQEQSGTYYDSADANFVLMGLRGVTVVVATGDDGANQDAAFGVSCAQAYATTTKLRVSWPASSPYVLAVGATEMNPNTATYYRTGDVPPVCGSRVANYGTMDVGYLCAKNGTEQAASITVTAIASAGGFSNIYSRPSWQANAVNAFMRTSVAKPPSTYYNSNKRAIPDVSAIGSAWPIIVSRSTVLIGGTSLAAPIWAAVISMLNTEVLRLNGTTLGFINPLLYDAFASDPTIFNDITQGNNICPIHKSCVSCVGWTATTGWDPVTGLGSPRYDRLLTYITNRIQASQQQHTCTPNYSWRSNSWSACSAACYNPTTHPTQTRTVNCVNSCTGGVVADSYCPSASRPVTTQSCTPTQLCFAQWSVNPTGTCSLPCGSGVRQLISTCRQSTTALATNINMISVPNTYCEQYTGYVPPTTQVCNNFKCPTTTETPTCDYDWNLGNWGSCSMGCYTPAAPAAQTRSVTCRSSCSSGSGSPTVTTVADSICVTNGAGAKPSLTQPCTDGLRNCYATWVTDWLSPCTRTCGGGQRDQYVGCWQQQGGNGDWADGYQYAEVANSICTQSQGYTPPSTVVCNTQSC